VSEIAKQFGGSAIIGFSRFDLAIVVPQGSLLSLEYDSCPPFVILLKKAHSFVSRFVGASYHTIGNILCYGTSSKIGPSVVKSIVVAMVNMLISAFNYLSMKGDIFTFPFTRCVVYGFAVIGAPNVRRPYLFTQRVIKMCIDDRIQSMGERYIAASLPFDNHNFGAFRRTWDFTRQTLLGVWCFGIATFWTWIIVLGFRMVLRLGISFQRVHGLTSIGAVRLNRTCLV
jgi:hypothetical protein